ncbi:MAG: hypothetical protein K2O42_09240 [Oscillospiraceae bacterium]|nr:hypothetical protein [Oscillospiraceae bacterium]
MKKVLIRSLITALVINTTGAIINLVSFFANGTFLLAQRINGGEYTGWRGFGLLLSRIIPDDPVHNPNAGKTSISLDLQSLLFILVAGFVLGFIVFLIVYLANKKKV